METIRKDADVTKEAANELSYEAPELVLEGDLSKVTNTKVGNYS